MFIGVSLRARVTCSDSSRRSMDTTFTRGPYTHLLWCTAGKLLFKQFYIILVQSRTFLVCFAITMTFLMLSQFRCGAHWSLLPSVCSSAGTGSRKWDPRPAAAGEEDETTEEEHAAREGQKNMSITPLFI